MEATVRSTAGPFLREGGLNKAPTGGPHAGPFALASLPVWVPTRRSLDKQLAKRTLARSNIGAGGPESSLELPTGIGRALVDLQRCAELLHGQWHA